MRSRLYVMLDGIGGVLVSTLCCHRFCGVAEMFTQGGTSDTAGNHALGSGRRQPWAVKHQGVNAWINPFLLVFHSQAVIPFEQKQRVWFYPPTGIILGVFSGVSSHVKEKHVVCTADSPDHTDNKLQQILYFS